MTIALSPRCTDPLGRLARLSCAARDVVGALPMRRPEPRPAVNAGRWATLPGEYVGPWERPLNRALTPLSAPGTTAPVACAGHGPVILHLGGAWRGSVVFEGSTDGTRWLPLPLASLDGDPDGSETDRPGLWRSLPGQSVNFIRLRVAHLAAGTILATVAAVPAIYHLAEQPLDSAA